MGLIDRDYMSEKRFRQARTPTLKKSAVSTLFMVLVFVAVLLLLYKLADWQLNKRASDFAAQSIPSAQPALIQASSRLETSQLTRDRSSHLHQEEPVPTPGHRVVTKCTINGKTSYGDGPCASGAVAAQVTTRADHNIMEPVRIAATVTTEATYSAAPVVVAQNTAPLDYAANKFECQSLDAHIQHLDSMSRQPQGAQTMDWIKGERKKARDRQFRIPCQ